MAVTLDKKIQDYLDLVIPPAKKELNFIKNHDWSKVIKISKRETKYNLQHLINDRNIKAFIKLYSIAENYLDHPTVKDANKLFVQFYHILEERYAYMDKKFDWTKFDQEDKDVEAKMEAEIKFQSEVLKHLTSFKEALRKINFGEEVGDLNVPIYSDKPIPLTMRESIEERYPEVREEIERKQGDV